MVREVFLRLVCVGAADGRARDAGPAEWAGIPRCADRVQLHLSQMLRFHDGAHGIMCHFCHTNFDADSPASRTTFVTGLGKPRRTIARQRKPPQSHNLRPVSSMNTSSTDAL